MLTCLGDFEVDHDGNVFSVRTTHRPSLTNNSLSVSRSLLQASSIMIQ